MNIIIINHYAGSPELGMEYRPYFLAREWVKKGHVVTVIGGSYSHVRINQPSVKKDFEEDIKDGIRNIWIKTPKYRGNGILRLFSMLFFVFKIFFNAKKISKKYNPDIVIASSTYPLDNYPAHKIAKISRAKYVYEVHDLWPLSPIELGGMSKNHPFVIIMQQAENFAYRKVDLVISILPKTLLYMKQHGLDPKKWHYVPNGIITDKWDNNSEPHSNHLTRIKELKKQGYHLIAYTGSIGLANALDNFIKAAEILKDKKIQFIIVGDGPEKNKLMNMVKDLELTNIQFLNSVPKPILPSLLELFDILYIGLQKQPLFRFGISPNKLLDYMMAGKPIIQAIDAGNNIVEEANCGISIEPENPNELAFSIQKVIGLTEKERITLGQNGKKYVLKNHDYSVLANKILEIFKSP